MRSFWLVVPIAVALGACDEGGAVAQAPRDALVQTPRDAEARAVEAGGDAGAEGVGDPGAPASFYGPKCQVAHSVGKPPGCISAITRAVPGGLQLFLNFCIANEMNVCQHEPEQYVSLVLPIERWDAVAKVDHAVAGRAWFKLYDGRLHEARAEAGRLPLDFAIQARPVMGGGVSYYGTLRMSLPRVDAPGEPLVVDAIIN